MRLCAIPPSPCCSWSCCPGRRPCAEHAYRRREAAGWKLLFDGQTTAGWRNYKKTTIGPGWKAENGALVRGTRRTRDIITVDKFGAFELSLEYNISTGGNSGLMYPRDRRGERPPGVLARRSRCKTS